MEGVVTSTVINERLAIMGFEDLINCAINFLNNNQFAEGGYPPRSNTDSFPSVTTTALICIMRKRLDNYHFDKTLINKDFEFIIKNFDNSISSWKIFGNEIPSPWTNAFCVWALSINNLFELECVENAVQTLLSWQNEGGWGVASTSKPEIIVTYMVVVALILFNLKKDKYYTVIKEKLKHSYDYFSKCLDEGGVETLNLTDCILAFQGINLINKYLDSQNQKRLKRNRISRIRERVAQRTSDIISCNDYIKPTTIKFSIKSGEWAINHFHPGVLHILSKYNQNPYDLFKIMQWFKENYNQISDSEGYWSHFANNENIYTTALSIIALYEFAKNPLYFDQLKIKTQNMEKDLLRINEENIALKAGMLSYIKLSIKNGIKYIRGYILFILALLGALGGIDMFLERYYNTSIFNILSKLGL
jgi:hypothetical protein